MSGTESHDLQPMSADGFSEACQFFVGRCGLYKLKRN